MQIIDLNINSQATVGKIPFDYMIINIILTLVDFQSYKKDTVFWLHGTDPSSEFN